MPVGGDGSAKHRIITLTDHTPVRIREDQWPVIAEGTFEDRRREIEIEIRVRRHQDGRAIVQGVCKPRRAGVLLDSGNDVPAAIRNVAELLVERVGNNDAHRYIRAAANNCIANLPGRS